MYEWKTRIRYSEVGTDGLLTVSSLINCFQDCVNLDSDDRKVGFWQLSQKQLGWILLNWQIEIKRFPRMGEHVVISTAPHTFRSTFGYRNFYMRDAEGTLIAVADSTWMMMDFAKMKPIVPPQEIIDAYTIEEPYPMEYSRTKIILGEDQKEQEAFRIGQQHLDTNNHVNNAQYVVMAQQYLPKDFRVSKLRVEYRKQAVLGDEIVPFTERTGNVCKVSLCNREHAPFSVLSFEGETTGA